MIILATPYGKQRFKCEEWEKMKIPGSNIEAWDLTILINTTWVGATAGWSNTLLVR